MAASITTLLIVPHTHWDREWHRTFQQFRLNLVKCVNHLLLILDTDPNFTNFMLDGQTIVLDDYLEIHPQEAEHLFNYVRAGRLLIGPWYVQPDEFLVSGEAIIRNLLIGTQRAAPYGGAMPVGYVPDCFGHIAQLPQIFQGFGIDNVVFWRGIDPAAEQSEFWWTSPDGSRALGVYLDGELGYSNARDLPLKPDLLLKRLERIIAQQGPHATTSTLLLMNGSDHLEPQDGLPAVLEAANALLAEQGQRLMLGTLPLYIQTVQDANPDLQTFSGEFRFSKIAHLLPGVLSTRMWIKQRNATCEDLLTRLVEPLSTWSWMLAGSYPDGLIAAAWKLLLQNQPHDSICGTSIDQVHREMAVRYDQCEQIANQLIQDAVQELVQHIDIQAIMPTVASGQEEVSLPLVVLNPVEARAVALAEISLQVHTPPEQLHLLDDQGQAIPHIMQISSGAEVLNQVVDSALLSAFLPLIEEGKVADYFIINVVFDETARNAQGQLLLWATISANPPEQRLYTQEVLTRIRAAIEAPEPLQWQVIATEPPQISLRFVARDLPDFGGRSYVLSSRAASEASSPASDIVASPTAIENSWLRVEADPATGTVTVTEKASGVTYTGLNRFQDGGDVGDLYNWMPPAEDRFTTEPGSVPGVELLNTDTLQATLRITTHLQLPVSCSEDRQGRHDELVDCPISTDVTLISGEQMVRFHTTVTNQARDHRLRVLFPTSIVTESAEAEGTFMVNTRPIRRELPANGWNDWIEEPVNTHPQKRFVSVSDGQHGLSLLNRGLPEYEILPPEDTEGVTIALTLLRCVGWLSRGDLTNRRGPAGPMLLTPEGQMIGTWSFDYALSPFNGSWSANQASIQRQAHAFNTDILAAAVGLHIGRLEPSWSFVRLEPVELVLSAIKRSTDGNGLIIRWYNPLDIAVTADIITALEFGQADKVSLNEEIRSPLPGESDDPTRHWRVDTPAGTIQTLYLSINEHSV